MDPADTMQIRAPCSALNVFTHHARVAATRRSDTQLELLYLKGGGAQGALGEPAAAVHAGSPQPPAAPLRGDQHRAGKSRSPWASRPAAVAAAAPGWNAGYNKRPAGRNQQCDQPGQPRQDKNKFGAPEK